ncbi:hypothetical protein SDC9_187492 [bioreactor metagenome]|uniref:Uncharacterized protein n=1 Tax=bioreactor metagenome TaxID=1076179 RepID=A0A645HLQ7_9ZZZZ
MRRHGETAEGQVAQNVRDAAVEDHGAWERLCGPVGVQVALHHPFGVGHAIPPREGVSAALHLLPNDRAAGFGDCVEATAGVLGEQAGLARTGAARHDEETVAHGAFSGLTGESAAQRSTWPKAWIKAAGIFVGKTTTVCAAEANLSDEKGRTI